MGGEWRQVGAAERQKFREIFHNVDEHNSGYLSAEVTQLGLKVLETTRDCATKLGLDSLDGRLVVRSVQKRDDLSVRCFVCCAFLRLGFEVCGVSVILQVVSVLQSRSFSVSDESHFRRKVLNDWV